MDNGNQDNGLGDYQVTWNSAMAKDYRRGESEARLHPTSEALTGYRPEQGGVGACCDSPINRRFRRYEEESELERARRRAPLTMGGI